jgi:hypothetical protein
MSEGLARASVLFEKYVKTPLSKLPINEGLAPLDYTKKQGIARILLSFAFQYTAMWFMAVLGDSIAMWGMPKNPQFSENREMYVEGTPFMLKDLGFMAIPFYCPLESPKNVQTYVDGFFQAFILLSCLYRKNGRIVLQRCFHLTTVMYLCRWMVVPWTYLPNPNPVCFAAETLRRNKGVHGNIIWYIWYMAQKLPPTACGNLLFSGHAAVIVIHLLIQCRYELWGDWWKVTAPEKGKKKGNRRWNFIYAIPISLACVGWLSTISCRSHYTVDVILGVMIGWLIVQVCDGQVFAGWKFLSQWEMRKTQKIKWEDVEEDDDEDSEVEEKVEGDDYFDITNPRAAIPKTLTPKSLTATIL